ncbi:MAG: hypothetical protein HKN43_08275 [Rhodothermales bacterium]|nr:hypothetical protein [Rhodothermales bacterium]
MNWNSIRIYFQNLMTLPDTVQIGDLTLKPLRRLLITPHGEETLDPLVMKLLVCLISKRGRVATREELVAEVWPDGFAGEQSLSRAIWALRNALGDDAKAPRFIETVPRIGYRFISDDPVEMEPVAHESAIDVKSSVSNHGKAIEGTVKLVRQVRRLQATVAVLGAVVIVLLTLLLTPRPFNENTEIITVRNDDGIVDSTVVIGARAAPSR